MRIEYLPQGTCSRKITIELDGDTIAGVEFTGGCTGNLKGIAALVAGRSVKDAVELLSGIQCRGGTSCPDQLAKALRQAVGKPKASPTRRKAAKASPRGR